MQASNSRIWQRKRPLRSGSALARVLFVLIGIALYLPYQVVIIPLSIMIAQTGLSRSHAS